MEPMLATIGLGDCAPIAGPLAPDPGKEERQPVLAGEPPIDDWLAGVPVGLGEGSHRHDTSATPILVLADDDPCRREPRLPVATRRVAYVGDEARSLWLLATLRRKDWAGHSTWLHWPVTSIVLRVEPGGLVDALSIPAIAVR